MKIAILGQGWLASEILYGLREIPTIDIVAASPDKTDDRFMLALKHAGIPIIPDLKHLPHCDLMVAAHCHRYVGAGILLKAQHGVLAYHPSLLPRHRGRDAIHWTLAMRDPILDSIHERLSWMTDRHCKVLFIRFDVRFPSWFHTDGGNSEISRLFKTLSERYAYNRTTFHYVWVREQSREKHQHYHCIAMLDGNKVQNYRGLHRDVSLIWGNILGSDPTGLIDYCNKDRNGFSVENGIMLRRPSGRVAGENLAEQRAAFEDAYERCIYWGSYLAKENQKMNTPRRMRNYGASAIRR